MKFSLKNIEWKVGGRLFGFGTSVRADWKIILTSTLALSIIIIILSVYMFIKIDKREVFVIEQVEDTENKNLNLTVLKETVSYYEKKALEFERIKKTGI